jgi:hypothetical protein
MDNSNERPVAPTREWLHAEPRRLDWARGLGEGTLAAIASTGLGQRRLKTRLVFSYIRV